MVGLAAAMNSAAGRALAGDVGDADHRHRLGQREHLVEVAAHLPGAVHVAVHLAPGPPRDLARHQRALQGAGHLEVAAHRLVGVLELRPLLRSSSAVRSRTRVSEALLAGPDLLGHGPEHLGEAAELAALRGDLPEVLPRKMAGLDRRGRRGR